MQNCSGGVNQDCIQAQQLGEEWKCFFAQVIYHRVTTIQLIVLP